MAGSRAAISLWVSIRSGPHDFRGSRRVDDRRALYRLGKTARICLSLRTPGFVFMTSKSAGGSYEATLVTGYFCSGLRGGFRSGLGKHGHGSEQQQKRAGQSLHQSFQSVLPVG